MSYISPFQFGSIGGNTGITYSSDQYKEVSAHELGHAHDILYANLQTDTALYQNYGKRDFFNFDYVTDGGAVALSEPRLPCAPTPIDPFDPSQGNHPGLPPFLGIVNLFTGNPVCDGPVLHSDILTQSPVPNSNSAVLQLIESGFWGNSSLWHEPYAQSFAFEYVGPLSARPVSDGVFVNQYFPCIRAWSDALIAGDSNPSPAPGSCSTSPSWYTPGQQIP